MLEIWISAGLLIWNRKVLCNCFIVYLGKTSKLLFWFLSVYCILRRCMLADVRTLVTAAAEPKRNVIAGSDVETTG